VAEAQGAMLGAHDLVLVSGYLNNGGHTTAEVYALNVVTGTTWNRMDDLPVSNGINHGAVAINDKLLYMCGGFTGSGGPTTDNSKG
jgi:N-acetylneuraminic acid mutarotase